MTFGGHGWRSGAASDITGVAATATVSGLIPSAGARRQTMQLTVQGSGFVSGAVVYANYSPIATTFSSNTQLICPSFNTTPDSGSAGPIPIGVRNRPTEALSNTVNFNAT
jgi:hypothetical protein